MIDLIATRMSSLEGILLFISEITKLTVLNLTKLGPWEADSIIKEIAIMYHIVKIWKVQSLTFLVQTVTNWLVMCVSWLRYKKEVTLI